MGTGITPEGLPSNITHAREQLKRARQDGGCAEIEFWTQRLDQLLDDLPRGES